MVKPTEQPNVGAKNIDAAEALLSPEQLSELVGETMRHLEEGKIVKGRVYGLKSDYVVVDIGYKSEGLIPLEEFRDMGSLQAGDEIDVLLESLEDNEGMVRISKEKADKLRNWQEIVTNYKEGDVIEGVIIRQVKGGMMVDIGIEAFLPASQLDIRYVKDKDALAGKKYPFKVIKINGERHNIVLSRRELLEEKRRRERDKLLTEINEGDLRTGVVKNITDFGVFIDLGGLDGLLHITDMTWGRISHPSELLAVGDRVEVKILSYDRDKQRVSLGLKQKQPNPWESVEEKYPVGKKCQGRVVNIMPYGAFIELEDGVEGLVHVSELSWTRKINHPNEMLAIGDIVEVVVLRIDPAQEKISLGIKQLESNPWARVAEKYPPGTIVKGRVRNITSYGAFMEVEPGIDGLIYVGDISWAKKISHPSQALKRGDKLEAKVLAVDPENKKISLGIKQLINDPWQELGSKFKVGDLVEGRVSNITGFGVFVELDSGIEGLVHISQVSDKPFENIEEIISAGDKVKAQVIAIDTKERKISLSIKNYLEGKVLDGEEVAAAQRSQIVDADTRLKDKLEEHLGNLSPPVSSESKPGNE